MTDHPVRLEEIQSGVGLIRIEDRDGKNAFSDQVIRGLTDSFSQVSKNQSLKAVVITGFENYFCSGGNKEVLVRLFEGKAQFSDSKLYDLPLSCEIPVIAAMQGHAIGGGLVFGLFCDFAILSRESVYTANFMKFGFTPGLGATLVLPNKLGNALGNEMLMGARSYRGQELANRGVPFPVIARPDVLPEALRLASELAQMPRQSLTELKAHLSHSLRTQLPDFVERELRMHELTFHQSGVLQRINRSFD